MLKERLNELEIDWAEMPQVEKEELNKLKGKTVIVSGRTVARCLCYALVYQSEYKKRDIHVIYAGDCGGFYPECTESEYFTQVSLDSVKEISKADLLISTGFCGESSACFPADFAEETRSARLLAETAERLNIKSVLLSDSRVYGAGKFGRVYAENEFAPYPNTDLRFRDNQLLRVLENIWNSAALSLTVLRTGIVLGGSSGLHTFLDEALEAVANGKPCALPNGRKYSFVYLTDVFRAVVYAFNGILGSTTYNLTAENGTASAGTIAAILHDVYGDKADLTLTKGGEENACAITNGKIVNDGCAPALTLEAALELCVMSYMSGDEILQMPAIHDGRLKTLQDIQLAYLLEVDRICKKHNIKYFLGGGTLIGAVRHKGFIPWDDDSDIVMLREDYDKFAKVIVNEEPEGTTFQSPKTDRNCFYEFNKLRVDGTMFASELAKNHRDIDVGIAFDVFCSDKTANSRWGQKLHLAMTLFTRALVLNKWNHRKVDNGSKIQSAFTNFCVRIFPLRFCYFLMNHTITFFKRKKNARYLYDGTGRNVKNGCFEAAIFDEVIYKEFEGHMFPVPKRYADYLTFLFGDFNELVPLSTRLGCHEITLLDVGKYDVINS